MLNALAVAGWHNYSLFLRDDGLLIGYVECDDFEKAKVAMSASDVNARWQVSMVDFFDLSTSRSPDQELQEVSEVFHLA